MARFAHADRKPVDRVAERWKRECLVDDGSLLWAGETIWTANHLDELVHYFNDDQLEGADAFVDKLQIQMEPVSRDGRRLMAETLLTLHLFATPNLIGPEKKREVIGAALRHNGEAVPEVADVGRALATGVGNPGSRFNRFRPDHVKYLIAFSVRVKALDAPERAALLEGDPWEFREWLVGPSDERDGGRQLMRHILLHLLFPEHFERVTSAGNKDAITATFADLLTEPQRGENEDLRLWHIRQRIEELLPNGQPAIGGAVDFYASPLKEAWDPEEDGREEDGSGMSPRSALQAKRAVVFYGPPGTGKTHQAKVLASELLHHHALERWGAVAYLQNQGFLEDLVAGQIRRLQLHQSYSYEDFVIGMRLDTGGGTVVQDGYLLRLIRDMEATASQSVLAALPWVLILDELNRVDLARLMGEMFSGLEDRGAPIDLPLPGPGGGARTLKLPAELHVIGTMNLIDQSVDQLDFALRRRFFWLRSGFQRDLIADVVRERWGAQEAAGRVPWSRLERDVELLAKRAETLNARVRMSRLLGEQYELGHSYFFEVATFIAAWSEVRLPNRRPRGFLWHEQSGKPQPPLLDLWNFSLRPLLAEYLAGVDPGQAQRELEVLAGVFLRGDET